MTITDRILAQWNSHHFDNIGELYADDYTGVDLTYRTQQHGPAGVKGHLERLWRAFPDLCFEIPKPIESEDRLVLGWTSRGTQNGTVMSIPPTGRRIAMNGITLFRLQNGKITKGIHFWDMAGMLRDLGLLPELDYQPSNAFITWQDLLPMLD